MSKAEGKCTAKMVEEKWKSKGKQEKDEEKGK